MNIIAYRNPGRNESFIYETGEAEKMNFSCNSNCFLVSPFYHPADALQYALTSRIREIPHDIVGRNDTKIKFNEFTISEYQTYLTKIKRLINGDDSKKIVASRRVNINVVPDVNELFYKLCDEYPDAFVFFISTKEFGSWIGATPELLLERKGDKLATMSLAGTRSIEMSGAWDEKNIKEQKIVTDYIRNTFKIHGLATNVKVSGTKKAGRIEHLMSVIECCSPEKEKTGHLLATLSPTPALCGYPKEEAIKLITENEGDRSLYGGFLGPVYSNGDFRLSVIIRCAYLTADSTTLFAGGGITYLSRTEEEWLETEKKLDTLRRLL